MTTNTLRMFQMNPVVKTIQSCSAVALPILSGDKTAGWPGFLVTKQSEQRECNLPVYNTQSSPGKDLILGGRGGG